MDIMNEMILPLILAGVSLIVGILVARKKKIDMVAALKAPE